MQHVADSALPVKMLRVFTFGSPLPTDSHRPIMIMTSLLLPTRVTDRIDRSCAQSRSLKSSNPSWCFNLTCVRAQAEQVKHSRPLASTLASSWTSAKLSAASGCGSG